MRTAHLFAGIGGMALAARWNGWTPQWVAEIDPYASKVLEKNFPGVPNLGDVCSIKGQAGSVDVLTGGFPCQDISLAGKGAGIAEGTRSGLWSEYARLIGELRPKYVLAENVSALRSRGLDRVLRDLDSLGYDAEWHCIPASHIGAPHRRDRIWIVAYPNANGSRLEGWLGERLSKRASEWLAGPVGTPQSEPGGPERGWWGAEPAVPRVADGVPNRVDRLRCLGNTIVPQEAFLIFQAIKDYEEGR